MSLTDARLDELLKYARQHGLESEPEHEVGDLQEVIFQCWDHLDCDAKGIIYDYFRTQWLGNGR